MNEHALTWDDVPAMLDDLRAMAQRLLSREGHAHSVQASDLVLTALRRQKPGGWGTGFDGVEVTWDNRAQFFGRMHRVMVQWLIEHGRQKKRPRQIKTVQIDRFDPDDFRSRAGKQSELHDALAHAMEKMEKSHPDWMDLVAYLVWERLTPAEAAELLGVDERTVRRWWNRIRLWLADEINNFLAENEK